MKIRSLLIENFRGITRVQAENLGDTVIIAGQNGSGKSCIFDAIRLLKSTYGGYQQNEWQHFFGEFAIQLHGGAKNLRGLFNDLSKPVIIECHFQLRDNEKAYINENLAELLEETIWQTLLPEAFQWGGYQKALFANQFRERQPEVTARVQEELPGLTKALMSPEVLGRIEISPQGAVRLQASRLLSVIFTNYKPRNIGVIDFHGAQRHYGREVVQGINLSLDQTNQQYSQHTLYNYNNKYNNVKSEMAGNYIKELLAEKACTGLELPRTLSNTLKELFESFFPDKKFLGPQPTADGSLSFPVVTSNGAEHDLDELSSGEKEILYGYLRIRSSAPRDSIILLDEPELHLNPRLIRGLPEFYRKHLGEALHNQIWLVTHSDALIREAVGKPGFNVFHMLPCGADLSSSSQLRPLTATHGLDIAIADLVGDLAAYRPGGKGLIFEGGGDSDFDKTLASALFQDELRGINLLSGSNKTRVKQLHEVLERAYQNGDLPTKFYAIVDRDSEDVGDDTKAVNRFVWDVYHVENYLLVPKIIVEVLNSLNLGTAADENNVLNKLEASARDVVPKMLQHKMRTYVNSKIVNAIDLGFNPNTSLLSKELHSAASRTTSKIKALMELELEKTALEVREREFKDEIEQSFTDGSWIKKVPGREILHRFIDRERVSVGYEFFRNLIVSRMADSGYKPAGMQVVIEKIVTD
jgi:predicted ATPase